MASLALFKRSNNRKTHKNCSTWNIFHELFFERGALYGKFCQAINFFFWSLFSRSLLLQLNPKLIAMENLRVRVAGTMKEVKERDPAIIREWDLAIAKENAKESQLR